MTSGGVMSCDSEPFDALSVVVVVVVLELGR